MIEWNQKFNCLTFHLLLMPVGIYDVQKNDSFLLN